MAHRADEHPRRLEHGLRRHAARTASRGSRAAWPPPLLLPSYEAADTVVTVWCDLAAIQAQLG